MKSWRIHAGIYPFRWRGGASRREMLERTNGDLDDPPMIWVNFSISHLGPFGDDFLSTNP
jgi:hypothetical protein